MCEQASSTQSSAGKPVLLSRERPLSWWQILGRSGCVKAAIVAALVFVAYLPELKYLAKSWTNKPDWTHGWLIPVISLYILHIDRYRIARLPVRPSVWGAAIMLLAGAMYIAGIVVRMGYPRELSLLLMIFGIVVLLCGWRVALACWFPIVLLIFAIPLPVLFYFHATLPLRKLVTYLTSGVLSLFPDLYVVPSGTIIEYFKDGRFSTLNVEEACSGMRLMMAFLAMGSILAYLMRDKPVWHRITLLVLCVPIAIFCNFLRVTISSILYIYVNRTLAQGGSHALLGLVMMLVALGLYWLANCVLSSLVTESQDEDAAVQEAQ